MQALLFAYDVVMLVALSGAVAGYVIAYVSKRDRILVWVAAYFALVICDHTYLFVGEFVDTATPGTLDFVGMALYYLLPPLLMVVERKIFEGSLDLRVRWYEWAFLGATAVGFVVDMVLDFETLDTTLSYVALAYLLVIWCIGIAALRRQQDVMEPGHYRFLFVLLVASLVTMIIGNVIEWNVAAANMSSSVRDAGSELLTVEYLVFAYAYLVRVFGGAEDKPELSRAEVLAAYARGHGLTAREEEILGLIVEGKSNQQIANELWLSLGTVKTHAHNIYHKVDVGKRGELIDSFMEYEKAAKS